MDIYEILDALGPSWELANRTDDDGKFLRPDYREALVGAWEEILVAYETKRRNAPPAPSLNLNVALAQRGRTRTPEN